MSPEREIMLLKRRLEMNNKFWLRAAEEALAGDPRALRNRVAMEKEPPVQIVLSGSQSFLKEEGK